MSDTPRTDATVFWAHVQDSPRTDAVECVDVDFARQLEREVAYWKGMHDGTLAAWKESLKKS